MIARARLRRGRRIPSLTSLEEEITQGYKLLAGGVLVHPDVNPPITADGQDPDFFRAIIGGDSGALLDTDLGELAAWRNYVLNDGPVPLRPRIRGKRL
jgi:hypothetical protein